MTYQEISNMSLTELKSVKLSELPETIKIHLNNELEFGKGIREDKATRVYFVSDNGRKVFKAERERGGKKMWTIRYYEKVVGLTRSLTSASGYGFGVIAKYFGKTADGTIIPSKVAEKAEVMEILNHIAWANK